MAFSSFSDLKRAFGLPQGKYNFLPQGFDTEFANEESNLPGLYGLYTGSLRPYGNSMSSNLEKNYGKVINQYQGAALKDPTRSLTFDQFLGDQFDPVSFYKSLNPFERGQRPSAYNRGYKILG